MNNTKTLAIVAILMATTLVVGTFATMATTTTTQSAYAYAKKLPRQDDKKTRDNGSGNRNGNTITALKCQNKGSASGFDTAVDQECENVICTHPGENATCSQEGVVTPTPKPTTTTLLVKKVCEKFETQPPQPPCILFPGLEFSIQITGNNGNNAQPSTFILTPDTSGISQQLVTLDPGTFTIVESAAFGSATTFSGDCKQTAPAPGIRAGTVTISVGQHLTCTITNTLTED
jgi:hypothetical protein